MMAATPEKTCLPQAKESKADYSELCPAKPEGEATCPNPDCSHDLLQQFNQLQERFLRTTNALASAAHDLKTPLAILSGATTPVEAMPTWLQPVTALNPVKHFAIISRSIMLKGSGIDVLYGELLALAAIAVVMVSLSAWRFRKQLS